jgi:aryl-alcohol dehydrogenase-like predicted oxidoreductase
VIDTAECYHNSEELIGQAVSKRRSKFYLFTKCGHPHGFGERADWSKDSILESIQRSLRRLKTDKIDIVQLHSCSRGFSSRNWRRRDFDVPLFRLVFW